MEGKRFIQPVPFASILIAVDQPGGISWVWSGYLVGIEDKHSNSKDMYRQDVAIPPFPHGIIDLRQKGQVHGS